MKYFVVDAFTDGPFTGNPAGVCVPDSPLDSEMMRRIAAENNLSETAFLEKTGIGGYNIRWFTPKNEVDLCGHATLASTYVVMTYLEPGLDAVRFASQSGALGVSRKDDLFILDFPAWPVKPMELLPIMEEAVGCSVLEAYGARDLFLLLESETAVREIAPDMGLLLNIPGYLGICVTAKGEMADFVSRFFAPGEGIPEDPVTGSAHSSLIPFWSERLRKTAMTARQLSSRGGVLYVRDMGQRVEIAGKARVYMEGKIII